MTSGTSGCFHRSRGEFVLWRDLGIDRKVTITGLLPSNAYFPHSSGGEFALEAARYSQSQHRQRQSYIIGPAVRLLARGFRILSHHCQSVSINAVFPYRSGGHILLDRVRHNMASPLTPARLVHVQW